MKNYRQSTGSNCSFWPGCWLQTSFWMFLFLSQVPFTLLGSECWSFPGMSFIGQVVSANHIPGQSFLISGNEFRAYVDVFYTMVQTIYSPCRIVCIQVFSLFSWGTLQSRFQSTILWNFFWVPTLHSFFLGGVYFFQDGLPQCLPSLCQYNCCRWLLFCLSPLFPTLFTSIPTSSFLKC